MTGLTNIWVGILLKKGNGFFGRGGSRIDNSKFWEKGLLKIEPTTD
jgi:hypothetical protein